MWRPFLYSTTTTHPTTFKNTVTATATAITNTAAATNHHCHHQPPPHAHSHHHQSPPITTTATATATVVAKRIGASARCSLRATACPKPCAGGLGMIRGSISIPFASVASQCHYDSHPPDLDLGLAGHAQ